jgi:predicted MFS family arabinose efflux permease
VTSEDGATVALRVDRPAAWLALIAIAAGAPITSGVLPAIVGALVHDQAFTADSAGHVSSLYSLAGVFAGLLGLLWIGRIDRRLVLASAILPNAIGESFCP